MPRSRWFVPAFSVGLGLVYLGVQWANDDPGGGLVSLAIMVAFAVALVAFSGRSGVAEVMRNPRADERSAMLDMRATAFAGLVAAIRRPTHSSAPSQASPTWSRYSCSSAGRSE